MVEYGIAIGYGIVVDNELMHNIYNHLDRSYSDAEKYCDVIDTLRERWSLEIDSWCGNDTFLGVIHRLDVEDSFVVRLGNYKVKEEAIKEFLHFITDHGIYQVIANHWQPEMCLIHYCH